MGPPKGKEKLAKDKIKWHDSWLNQIDENGDRIGLWCKQRSSEEYQCTWCIVSNSFTSQGGHALKQHAKGKTHIDRRDEFHNPRTPRLTSFSMGSSSSSKGNDVQKDISLPTLSVQKNLDGRVLNAEVLWLMKVARSDYSLSSCDSITELFNQMFHCDVTKSADFSLGRNKASYSFSDGLRMLLLKLLVEDVAAAESCFTLLFDETTNSKNKKQMDLLVRYWCERNGEVVTRFLTTPMFGRCTHEQLRDKFMNLMDMDVLKDLPWDRFFNISSDGPNINIALYRVLNKSLKEAGLKGLLPLLVCCLHIVHNGFHKGITLFGQDSEQLAFDLHAWFKQTPCKEEDYRSLAEDSEIENESLFLRHLDTRARLFKACLNLF